MDPLLFASTSRQTLSETIDGGNYAWPDFIAGSEVFFGLRTTNRREGKHVLNPLDVVDAFAAVGNLDARPSSGTTRLKLGPNAQANGANTTAELSAGFSATDLAAAFAALSEVGNGQTYPEPEVTEEFGSFLVVFPGHPDPVEIEAVDNELSPCSLVRVIEFEKDGEHVHAVRVIQTPAAFASAFEERVPPGPYVERVQAGGEIDGQKTNEIQVLVRPSEFLGNYQFHRDEIGSDYLSRADGPEQIKAALDELADEDGFFNVRNSNQGEALIEFDGSMAGTGQDLLEVSVPRAPAADLWLSLDLNHADFFGLLREKDNVRVPLHIRILYRDRLDANVIRKVDFISEVVAKRGLHWDGLETKVNLDFLKKPADSYVPTADGQIITGNQHLVASFPTSQDVGAASFTFTHNLNSEDGHFSVRENATPGAALVEGVDFQVSFDNASQFVVTLLPGGFFGTPVVNAGDSSLFNLNGGGTISALAALSLTYTTAGPASAFQAHPHEQEDVNGLVDALADLFSRVTDLEALIPNGKARVSELSTEGGAVSSWDLEPVQVAFPLSKRRLESIEPWPAKASDFLALDYRNRPLVRPGRGSLLPAVHDAAPENLSTAVDVSFPEVGDFTGRVFENDGTEDLAVAGAGGRPTDYVKPGEFLACDGVAWYAVERQECPDYEESSYYPRQFSFPLFCFPVNEAQLELKRTFEFFFAFEAALLRANTKGHLVLEVELGQSVEDDTPAETGENLDSVSWDCSILTRQIHLSGQPGAHTFGVRVRREKDATNQATGDKLTLEAIQYGNATAATAPSSANFWIRGRLRNFDVEDDVAEPAGLLVVNGLDLPEGYESAQAGGDYGTAKITA